MERPTIQECFEHCNNMEQSVAFHGYFESVDWQVGNKSNRKPMVKWKAALTGWINRSKKTSKVDQAVSNNGNRFVDRLWVRLTEIYGHKWTSSYGAEPTRPWIEVVSSLSPEAIKYGLNQVLKNGDTWPPTLIEFNKLCKMHRNRLNTLALPTQKQISDLRENTSHIRHAEMDKIRAIL